jgi:hypothetical protein
MEIIPDYIISYVSEEELRLLGEDYELCGGRGVQ